MLSKSQKRMRKASKKHTRHFWAKQTSTLGRKRFMLHWFMCTSKSFTLRASRERWGIIIDNRKLRHMARSAA